MTESCSAIILAGGQSRRMGQPKAWLDFHGRPLLVHMVDLLSTRFDEIVVVAAPAQELPETSARVVRDEVPWQGPVAGLASGLRETAAAEVFVTAVDGPLLRLEVIDLLRQRVGVEDGAVPLWDGRLQPLCAVYRTAVLRANLESQLLNHELRLMEVFKRMRIVEVPEEVLRSVDPEGVSFLAANTKQEYARLLSLACGEH
jgi:molybdenum cofactor guanylyltransferase